MILTVRRYLLVLLGLLQLVAPLVHAHSGNNFVQFGLHLPNLEVYSVITQQNMPLLQTTDYLSSQIDAIVSISSGIKNQNLATDEQPALLYFSPVPFVFSIALISCEINFSPQPSLNTKSFIHSPQSPRAPPFLNQDLQD
jgi:hypothetical protein